MCIYIYIYIYTCIYTYVHRTPRPGLGEELPAGPGGLKHLYSCSFYVLCFRFLFLFLILLVFFFFFSFLNMLSYFVFESNITFRIWRPPRASSWPWRPRLPNSKIYISLSLSLSIYIYIHVIVIFISNYRISVISLRARYFSYSLSFIFRSLMLVFFVCL